MKLSLLDDTAEILGRKVYLDRTTSGHYCIALDKVKKVKVQKVRAVSITTMDKRETHDQMSTIHKTERTRTRPHGLYEYIEAEQEQQKVKQIKTFK